MSDSNEWNGKTWSQEGSKQKCEFIFVVNPEWHVLKMSKQTKFKESVIFDCTFSWLVTYLTQKLKINSGENLDKEENYEK